MARKRRRGGPDPFLTYATGLPDLIGAGFLIGLPLLCFSVLLPIAKTLTMMLAVLSRGTLGHGALSLIHRIGKWSMADVCVVGWLLGFMAVERQAFMQAEAQVGILFFACYAVLSIAAAQLLESRPAVTPPPPSG